MTKGVRVKAMGQLEAAVMQRLWDADHPQSVREVLEDLQRGRNIAYTTVMTVLENLHRKDLVDRHKEGRAFLYVPRLTREEHTAALMDDVLTSSTDRGLALVHFVGQLEPEELDQLRGVLDGLDHTPPTAER